MIRVVSLSLAAAVVSLGFFIASRIEAESYKKYIEYSNQRALSDLASSITNIDSALQKSLYSNSPAYLSSVSAEIWRESASAKASLAQLPLADAHLDKIQKFISQAGEYAYAISKKTYKDSSLDDSSRQNLASLSENASALAQNINNIKSMLDDGRATFDDIIKSQNIKNEAASNSSNTASFSSLEEDFKGYATLIYDGPFSDHLEKQAPLFLAEKTDISEEAALKIAADFLDIAESDLSFGGESAGKIPSYFFHGGNDDSQIYIELSKAGGIVFNMSRSGAIEGENLTPQKAVDKARAFLAGQGFGDMKESYYTKVGNALIINFTAVQDNVTLYPDLVKVGISLGDGSIRAFEARGYLMSHRTRTGLKPSQSISDAKSRLSPDLTVLSEGLALIPSKGKNEVLCFEFICEDKQKRHLIVYVNAQTGDEEDILILIESENGTLTV